MNYSTLNFVILGIFVLIGFYVSATGDLMKLLGLVILGICILPIILFIANLLLAIKLKDYDIIKFTFIPILIPVLFMVEAKLKHYINKYLCDKYNELIINKTIEYLNKKEIKTEKDCIISHFDENTFFKIINSKISCIVEVKLDNVNRITLDNLAEYLNNDFTKLEFYTRY